MSQINSVAETPAVQFMTVSKWYGTTQAVKDLNFQINRGSVCGLLGPNGAGKSTIIRMIMSIIYPNAGSIEVLQGNALSKKDRIGYLPEERGIYRKMRVSTFLSYVGKLKGMPSSSLRTRISELLKKVGLAHVENKKCEELSKGMQQKVQFLAAIVHEPELLILDEPFSGLDPVSAQDLQRLIFMLKEKGVTIMLSTHLLHKADEYCDRFIMINRGLKVLDATMSEIQKQFSPQTITIEPLEKNRFADELISSDIGVKGGHKLGNSGRFQLELFPAADPQAVMHAILGRIPVRSIEIHRVTLDDVFVQLVGGGVIENCVESAVSN